MDFTEYRSKFFECPVCRWRQPKHFLDIGVVAGSLRLSNGRFRLHRYFINRLYAGDHRLTLLILRLRLRERLPD